jgi:hypothetical protein
MFDLLQKSEDLTTERTEITEKSLWENLCALRVLCGDTFSPWRRPPEQVLSILSATL